MKTNPMMACGHAANAKCTASGGVKFDPPVPSCAICGCIEVAETTPDLTGRVARCADCRKERPSDSDKLAFFEYVPDREYDRYYCGCGGWD